MTCATLPSSARDFSEHTSETSIIVAGVPGGPHFKRVTTIAWRVLVRADRLLGSDLYWGLAMGRRLAPRIASGRARAGVVGAGLLFGSLRWHRPLTLRLDAPGGPIRFVVPDYSAFKVLHEMFVLREYDFALEPPPRRILDLGANIGASVLFFRRRWPDAQIVAVEASPRLAAVLDRNVRHLAVDVHHQAVAAQSGTIEFHESEHSWAGTTAAGTGPTITVPAVALDELLDEQVDLVKVDIEGAEFDVFAAANRLDRVGSIFGEAHALPTAPETRRLLESFAGFQVSAEPAKGVFTLFSAIRDDAAAGVDERLQG